MTVTPRLVLGAISTRNAPRGRLERPARVGIEAGGAHQQGDAGAAQAAACAATAVAAG